MEEAGAAVEAFKASTGGSPQGNTNPHHSRLLTSRPCCRPEPLCLIPGQLAAQIDDARRSCGWAGHLVGPRSSDARHVSEDSCVRPVKRSSHARPSKGRGNTRSSHGCKCLETEVRNVQMISRHPTSGAAAPCITLRLRSVSLRLTEIITHVL